MSAILQCLHSFVWVVALGRANLLSNGALEIGTVLRIILHVNMLQGPNPSEDYEKEAKKCPPFTSRQPGMINNGCSITKIRIAVKT
jgi:hypothetical protein